MEHLLPLALKQIKGYGNIRVNQLLYLPDEWPANEASVHHWIHDRISQHKLKLRVPSKDELINAMDIAYKIIDDSHQAGITMITTLDDKFPKQLRSIPNAPVVLFYKGNYGCIELDRSIALVGTREPTEHGRKIAKRLGYVLGREKFTVVSGLAIGCDQLAHEGCLEAGASTVAVMPSGLDIITPASNTKLAEIILKNNGCLISEYPIGKQPARNAFVERDRLQSGLSRAVLVVETDIEGGTMHTVSFAEKQGRILACYQHPEKLQSEPKTRGNQLLIGEKRAYPIKDDASLKEFMATALNYKYDANHSGNDSILLYEYVDQLTLDIFSPPNRPGKGIIFDLDLTLIDTSKALELRSKRQWKEVYKLIPEFSVYDGVLELIDLLKSSRLPICIVTSGQAKYCQKVLEYWNIDITQRVCYHDTNKHKPHPEPINEAVKMISGEPQNVLSIGDEPKDILASKEAGVISIGAMWGTLDKQKLVDSKPDHLFYKVSELKEFIVDYYGL